MKGLEYKIFRFHGAIRGKHQSLKFYLHKNGMIDFKPENEVHRPNLYVWNKQIFNNIH